LEARHTPTLIKGAFISEEIVRTYLLTFLRDRIILVMALQTPIRFPIGEDFD
jgi:hypothetical protein